MELEFKGYWSDRDKELWQKTDWKARDYKELPVDTDTFTGIGYFYSINGVIKKRLTFIKYIRSNPIFPPYYGPIYDSELLEFMKNNSYCYPSYDGRTEGHYDIHDRFDDNYMADLLSR